MAWTLFNLLPNNMTQYFTVHMHILTVHCHLCPRSTDNGVWDQIKFLTEYKLPHQLCSSSYSFSLCILTPNRKPFGDRFCFFAGPTVWNSLPFDICSINFTPVFWQALKTNLFKSYLVSNSTRLLLRSQSHHHALYTLITRNVPIPSKTSFLFPSHVCCQHKASWALCQGERCSTNPLYHYYLKSVYFLCQGERVLNKSSSPLLSKVSILPLSSYASCGLRYMPAMNIIDQTTTHYSCI